MSYGDTEFRARKASVPGAGAYNDIGKFDSQGKYMNSTLSSSKAAIWNREDKLKPSGAAAANIGKPGPGDYEHKGNVAEMHQNVSFYSTIKTRTFGAEGKPEWYAAFQSPGPAAYQLPSDFGYVTA